MLVRMRGFLIPLWLGKVTLERGATPSPLAPPIQKVSRTCTKRWISALSAPYRYHVDFELS